MLASVIGNYLDTLGEREFDLPFVLLLRLHDFYDIHFLHGSFEFGKDFIAKRREGKSVCQYLFQTKAGDIGLSVWNEARGQIDMLRTNTIVHPNFNEALQRKARFVTTGRLAGAAPAAAQSYKNHLASLKELAFEIWDKNDLVEMLIGAPHALSVLSPSLLRVLGAEDTDLTFDLLERYSQNWVRPEISAANLNDAISASLISHHCVKSGRLDLACYVHLMLCRSILQTSHGTIPPKQETIQALAAAKGGFEFYSDILCRETKDRFLNKGELVAACPSPGFASYQITCSVILEVLGLRGLLDLKGSKNRTDIATYLRDFTQSNLGCQHPVSDRWATPIVCASLLMYSEGYSGAVYDLLRGCAVWIADHYEKSIGLASASAGPLEEVSYLLGGCFEHIQLKRTESTLATVVLDLTATLGFADLYDQVHNDFQAAGICLPVSEVGDITAQYSSTLPGVTFEPNMHFAHSWHDATGGRVAPHHWRGIADRYASTIDLPWAQLILSSVVRDRHFVQTWRSMI